MAGHDAGDALLREVAGTLSAAARDGDLVARLGGDEFALVVDSGPEEAFALAERLVALLDRTHRFPTARPGSDAEPAAGPPLHVSASIGVAEIGRHGDASTTMREADLALRTAKADGKNGVRACGQALVEETGRRSRLARDLPLALERGELRVVYQPVVGIDERRVARRRGARPLGPPRAGRGLARGVRRPGRGGRADRAAAALGASETATADHARLVAGGRDLRLARQRLRAARAGPLPGRGRRAARCAASGLPADRLMIELTESVFTDDAELLRSTLGELSELGVRHLPRRLRQGLRPRSPSSPGCRSTC